MVPSCSLDAAGLQAQRDRYRQIADGASVERRGTLTMSVSHAEHVAALDAIEFALTAR